MAVLQAFVTLRHPPSIGNYRHISPLLLTLLLTMRHNCGIFSSVPKSAVTQLVAVLNWCWGHHDFQSGRTPLPLISESYKIRLKESFVATLKTELLYRNAWPTRQAARRRLSLSSPRASTTQGGDTPL